MNEWEQDQRRLMRAYEQATPDYHQSENVDQATRYLKMIVEEVGETLIAANPDAADSIKGYIAILERLAVVSPNRDLVKVWDGAIDIHVVTLGFQVSMALPASDGWLIVFEENQKKIGPDGKVRKDKGGKVLKPAGFTPPDLRLRASLVAHGRIAP